ncbi:MAG: hypothetical protein ACREH5_00620 [Candidatus Omnitrophota bacterium]
MILQRIPPDNWQIIRDWINETMPSKIKRDQVEKIKRLGRGGKVCHAASLGSTGASSPIWTIIRYGPKRVLLQSETGTLWRMPYNELKPLTEAVLEKAQ